VEVWVANGFYFSLFLLLMIGLLRVNFSKDYVLRIHKSKTSLMFAGMFFIPTKADAKMFGQECETVFSGGGSSCVTTTTICK
jgi:hypothetical protein